MSSTPSPFDNAFAQLDKEEAPTTSTTQPAFAEVSITNNTTLGGGTSGSGGTRREEPNPVAPKQEPDTKRGQVDKDGDLWLHRPEHGWCMVPGTLDGDDMDDEGFVDLPTGYGPYVALSAHLTGGIKRELGGEW